MSHGNLETRAEKIISGWSIISHYKRHKLHQTMYKREVNSLSAFPNTVGTSWFWSVTSQSNKGKLSTHPKRQHPSKGLRRACEHLVACFEETTKVVRFGLSDVCIMCPPRVIVGELISCQTGRSTKNVRP